MKKSKQRIDWMSQSSVESSSSKSSKVNPSCQHYLLELTQAGEQGMEVNSEKSKTEEEHFEHNNEIIEIDESHESSNKNDTLLFTQMQSSSQLLSQDSRLSSMSSTLHLYQKERFSTSNSSDNQNASRNIQVEIKSNKMDDIPNIDLMSPLKVLQKIKKKHNSVPQKSHETDINGHDPHMIPSLMQHKNVKNEDTNTSVNKNGANFNCDKMGFISPLHVLQKLKQRQESSETKRRKNTSLLNHTQEQMPDVDYELSTADEIISPIVQTRTQTSKYHTNSPSFTVLHQLKRKYGSSTTASKFIKSSQNLNPTVSFHDEVKTNQSSMTTPDKFTQPSQESSSSTILKENIIYKHRIIGKQTSQESTPSVTFDENVKYNQKKKLKSTGLTELSTSSKSSPDKSDLTNNSEKAPPKEEKVMPLLSILNIVVDFVMRPPCPLEAFEFQISNQVNRSASNKKLKDISDNQTPPKILVPVMRIFGPILKDGKYLPDSQKKDKQQQNGCLHIHNAFPYLLARPLFAGPDGYVPVKLDQDEKIEEVEDERVDNKSREEDKIENIIDWNDPTKLSLLVDDIAQSLEECLQSNNAKTSNTTFQKDNAQSINLSVTRFIRQITIESGRGFYTYCDGPPAPFLKVEYYDPRDRWRVKACLEKGIDMEVDILNNICDNENETIPTTIFTSNIKFRCYEAHIPYTMQIFKDLNLAGMTYIKVREGRFRTPLPRSTSSEKDFTRDKIYFTNTSVKSNLCWNHNTDTSIYQKSFDDENQGKTSACLKKVEPNSIIRPINLESEIHNSATNATPNVIVETYVEQNPSSNISFHCLGQLSEERDSLSSHTAHLKEREISKNGSTRDGKIANLKEKEKEEGNVKNKNLLSGKVLNEDKQWWLKKETSSEVEIDTTISEIMNVNDIMTPFDMVGDSAPEKESEIFWRAVPSLYELWQEERSRMKRLLPQSLDFLNFKGMKKDTEKEKLKNSLPGAKQAIKGMRKLFDAGGNEWNDYRKALDDIYIRYKDIIDMEDNLIANMKRIDINSMTKQDFGGEENNPCSSQQASPSSEDAIRALAQLGDQFSQSVLNDSHTLTQWHFKEDQVTESKSRTQSFKQRNAAKIRNMKSNQLLTAEDYEFGRCVDQGGQTNVLEGIIDPQTLTPFDNDEMDFDIDGNSVEEIEKNLSGLLKGTNSPGGLEWNALTSNDLSSQCQKLSDQTHDNRPDFPTFQIENTIYEDSESLDLPISSTNSILSIMQQDLGSNSNETSLKSEMHSTRNSKELTQFEKIKTSIQLPTQANTSKFINLGSIVEPKMRPPLRSQWNDYRLYTCRSADRFKHEYDNRLMHLKKYNQENLPWLHFTGSYQNFESSNINKSHKRAFPSHIFRKRWIEPTLRPPNPKLVRFWIRKRKRIEIGHNQNKLSEKQKPSPLGAKIASTKDKTMELIIDENSRKRITKVNSSNTEKSKNVAFFGVSNSCGIEEVNWDDKKFLSLSQNAQSSFSQISNFTISDEHDESKLKVKPLNKKDSPESRTEIDSSLNQKMLHEQANSINKGIHHLENSAESSLPPHSWTQHPLGQTNDNSLNINPLDGMGNVGGRLHVEGGGLKANTNSNDNNLPLPTPLTIMSIEVHVQCRAGKAGLNDSKIIAMKPDPSKDAVFAITYIFARDPGGGESLRLVEEGCIFRPVEAEFRKSFEPSPKSRDTSGDTSASYLRNPRIHKNMGLVSNGTILEQVDSERQLLLRLASVVQWKDPDALMSWDTQGAGLGYLIERGELLDENGSEKDEEKIIPVDLVRLLGRTPKAKQKHCDNTISGAASDDKAQIDVDEKDTERKREEIWKGSGLGSEWDERVGAGAAAASIVGRIIFCGWKIISEEVKHPNVSYQPAVVAAVLRKRIPHHDDLILSRWYGQNGGQMRWRVLKYRLNQTRATLLLFDSLDVIGRAGEAARLSGVEFSQSLPGIRGSQYKVEGVLLRALKSVFSDERGVKSGRNAVKVSGQSSSSMTNTQKKSQSQSPWKLRRSLNKTTRSFEENKSNTDRGYFFFSPSKDDCLKQEALECQAMTIEPQSGFHYDPVVVCDFTALYPSLVIAYNLCYSTCAGKLDYHSTRSEMGREGRTTGQLGPFQYSEHRSAAVITHHMKSLGSVDENNIEGTDRAYVVPTGSIFVSESVIKGVLPQVLKEILATRAMLKKAAKHYRKHVPNLSPSILRQLEARQLALKYVANVTYGYTSATFSGRSAMPLLADTIVECGRRTLTNAINLANSWGRDSKGRWSGAEVIYGDTDSIFVKLPGRTVKEAFDFGTEFCKVVTASNPPPVELKLEKVYAATLLQTKKKYCGMKYECSDQKKPIFEAKGIETIRRDQCSLTQKILRNALITLFRKGLIAVKQYLYRQWALIHAGRLPVADFILTGRVRNQYRGGRMGPVQATLARRLAEADPGRVVRHKERLPYVIVASPGRNFKLRDCVLTPMELLEQWDSYTIHSTYYSTKHVNASLQRCLGLPPYNVNINAWYEACPKPRRRLHFWPITKVGATTMISNYFGSDICSLCEKKCMANGSSRAVVCGDCMQNKTQVVSVALTRLNKAQQISNSISKVCEQCNGCIENSGTFAIEKGSFVDAKRSFHQVNNTTFSTRKMWKSSGGIITPLANCICIDCPVTFERHRVKELEIQSLALCRSLELF